MATIIRLSFWHHLFIIGSSVIPINGIVPFGFQKGVSLLLLPSCSDTMRSSKRSWRLICHGNMPRHCITDSNLTWPSQQVFKPPSCYFSCEATSFFRCKGSMRRPFRLWATGTTPYWPMILWKSSFFFSHSVQQLPLPTKRVFAENALAHPSICITLIAPVKFDV